MKISLILGISLISVLVGMSINMGTLFGVDVKTVEIVRTIQAEPVIKKVTVEAVP